MKTDKIAHIGIAVPNIQEYVKFYTDVLGIHLGGTETLESQKVKVAFLTVGDSRIELLEPTSSDSPVQKFLDKNGGKSKIHHIAYEVEDLLAALEDVKAKGLTVIDEIPRVGAGGVKIAFIHPKSSGGVLTELCEPHR